VGKWGLQEVDLNPSLGFVHLGYGTMQTTTHCVVELVSGHSSVMKYVMAVSRECMVWLCHKVAQELVMKHVMAVSRECMVWLCHREVAHLECMVWWCHDREETRGVSWVHACLHTPCEGPTEGLPQKGLLCQREAIALMSGCGLAVAVLVPVGCPFPQCAVVYLV
jgi:hypothetical protein